MTPESAGIEHRQTEEIRFDGRTLRGVVMPYGTIAPGLRELFEARAFGPVKSVALDLQHDPNMVIAEAAELRDTPTALTLTTTLAEGSAALSLVRRRALRGLSVAFRALEQRMESGLRIISRAQLVRAALVDVPAYPAATIEIRQRSGRTLRQRIPADVNLGCECSGAGCKWARFQGEAMREMWDNVWGRFQQETLAVRSNYGNPIASRSAGTLRGHIAEDGAGVVEVDLPMGPDGDAIQRAIGDTGAVLVRPYLDVNASESIVQELRQEHAPENVRVYSSARIRSFVVGATDAVGGWPMPELVATPDDVMTRAEDVTGPADQGVTGRRRVVAVSIGAQALADATGAELGNATRLLAVATLRVQDYAPDAPTALQDEAVIRFAGYLDTSSATFGARHVLGGRPVDGILPCEPRRRVQEQRGGGPTHSLPRAARREGLGRETFGHSAGAPRSGNRAATSRMP